MRSIENTKNRIRNIVELYKKEFAVEYDFVCGVIRAKRETNNDKFARTKGDSAIKRALYEIPERLSASLVMGLDFEESAWLKELPSAKWFAKEFPEFRSGDEN